ncbi:MAG TPA: MerR family DNA-binding protein [Aggregatilineales bacterium]|nr:MerR family DNA-binding protein [Aggregatilineales bacterium]
MPPRTPGFTISEIRLLLHEFPADTPPSVRWQSVAFQKLEEIEVLLRRVRTMKSLLEQVLLCKCPTLEECASGMRFGGDNPEVPVLCGHSPHSD